MAKPCDHNPAKHNCHRCWLAENDARYRVLWGIASPEDLAIHDEAASRKQTAATIPYDTTTCVYRNGPTGDRVASKKDPTGRFPLKVFGCTLHGTCTLSPSGNGHLCCCGCGDRISEVPYTGVVVRNLIYHVYPIAGNGVWQTRLTQLLNRIDLFNGKRVIGIMHDERTDTPETVKAFLGVNRFDRILINRNDPRLREVVTMRQALPLVGTTDHNHITFLGHAKGVTHEKEDHIHLWAEMIQAASWDYMRLVEHQLRYYHFTGPFKKVGHGFRGSRSSWHYSGGMYWIRNVLLFSERESKWRYIDPQWWGSESYPGLIVEPRRAATLICEGRVPSLDLYKPRYVHGEFSQSFEEWKAANEHNRTA